MSNRNHPIPNTNACPRRILVPVTDDAHTDAAAFDRAGAFAAALHAELDGADRHVLHHSPVPVLVVPSS